MLALAVLAGLTLVGDARMLGDVVRLTPAEQRAGAAWDPRNKPIADGFVAAFRFRISEPGGLSRGADGFAFVVQNAGPEAIAGRGGAGGFSFDGPEGEGARRRPIGNSIAVFFDT